MEVLTFRPTRRQLRFLALFVLALALFGAVILVIRYWAEAKVPDTVVNWAVGAAFAAMLAGWILLRYSRALTECSPEGIRSRGIRREWRCDWKHVRELAIRASSNPRGPTTYTAVLTTTGGDDLPLGMPVTGGIMPDPDFEDKVRKIRSYWSSAVGAHAEGDTPVPRVRGAAAPIRRSTLARLGVGMLLITAVITIPFTIRGSGPALLARLGYGQPGSFTATATACDTTCYWAGNFESQAGGVARAGLAMAPGAPITHAGQRVPAVLLGNGPVVYPPGAGPYWLPLAVPLAVIIGCLVTIAVWTMGWRGGGRKVTDYRPGARTRPEVARPVSVFWAQILIALWTLVLIFGGAAGYAGARSVPVSPARSSIACAYYGGWLAAQPNGAPPGRDPQLLAEAVRLAPPASPLGADLATLRPDVILAASATSTDEIIADEGSVVADLNAVTHDCYPRIAATGP